MHSSGIRARRPVGRVREVEALQQLGGPPARLRRREVEQTPEHLQVLAPREDLVDRGELPGQAQHLANGRRLAHHVAPEDLGVPRVRREQGREHTHERGLPGSVRPEQPEDRALGDLQIDPRERHRRAEALDYARDAHGGSGGTLREHLRGDDTPRPNAGANTVLLLLARACSPCSTRTAAQACHQRSRSGSWG